MSIYKVYKKRYFGWLGGLGVVGLAWWMEEGGKRAWGGLGGAWRALAARWDLGGSSRRAICMATCGSFSGGEVGLQCAALQVEKELKREKVFV